MDTLRLFHIVGIVMCLGLGAVLACPPAASAADKPQDFFDEVGRLLYSIDAQGVVSMFETDALDNTLSVTRGTRESLQPRITEISPPRIETGKVTVVTFKGRNLVGAKFASKTPGIKFGGSAPRAASVGVPIEVDSSVNLGPLAIEVATPIGSTKVTLTVIEPQIDLAALARKQEPEYREPSAGKPESCPEGMIPVGSKTGGFCVDLHETQAGDWVEVEKLCSYKFKRLCWAEEWEQACKENEKSGLGLQNLLGEWEWTRNSEYAAAGEGGSGGVVTENEDWLAVVRGKQDCTSKGRKDPWLSGTRPGRCCR
ncbi:MAG TPA: hypothetical protein VI337_02470 [Nitrospirales bacterium]|nr:hypothetical protein [Nitrospirales bacterium]